MTEEKNNGNGAEPPMDAASIIQKNPNTAEVADNELLLKAEAMDKLMEMSKELQFNPPIDSNNASEVVGTLVRELLVLREQNAALRSSLKALL